MPGTTDRYLVFSSYPLWKLRTAPTIERAEAIARKFAEESAPNCGPVCIYEKIAQARLSMEVTFQDEE